MNLSKHKNGFTIVELLIVIVVIGILAAITIVAFNGVSGKAKDAKQQSDIAAYKKAIFIARESTGKVLKDITGSGWSLGNCSASSKNTGNVEPKNLPKDNACWTNYYEDLSRIGAAAGMDLSNLRSGDANGNPYTLDENEGETCGEDVMYVFKGDGTASYAMATTIPRTAPC